MVALLKVPTTELTRVNDANGRLIDVAKSLSQIADAISDENLKAELYEQIRKILDNVTVANTVFRAVASSAGNPKE